MVRIYCTYTCKFGELGYFSLSLSLSPLQYAALDSTATNLAVAGKAGFALYSGSRRRWKLFGNELQEQGLVCRGGLAWYKELVVFPCRVQERDEEVHLCTCNI